MVVSLGLLVSSAIVDVGGTGLTATMYRWGVAGAAFQIEGAAKAEGRGPSVWDALTRVTNHIVDNSTADVADNVSYITH